MKRPPAWRFTLLGAAAVSGLLLSARPLSLERFVLPGGGGSSSSSRFSVDGSIGQPVAASEVSIGSSLPIAERPGFWPQILRWISVSPVTQADLIERRPGQSGHVLIRTLLANDTGTDLESLGFASFGSTTSAGGTVYRDGPWLVYQPPDSGTDPEEDSFTYTARDAVGTVVAGTVRIRFAGPPAGGPPNAVGVDRISGTPARIFVRFLGIAGRTYGLETAESIDGPWLASGSLTAAADGSMVHSEDETVGPRYFRIRENP